MGPQIPRRSRSFTQQPFSIAAPIACQSRAHTTSRIATQTQFSAAQPILEFNAALLTAPAQATHRTPLCVQVHVLEPSIRLQNTPVVADSP